MAFAEMLDSARTWAAGNLPFAVGGLVAVAVLLFLGVNAAFRRLNFSFAGYFTGIRTDSDFLGLGLTHNPGYARFDLATSYLIARGISFTSRVTNLFDKQYQDVLGFPALGQDMERLLHHVDLKLALAGLRGHVDRCLVLRRQVPEVGRGGDDVERFQLNALEPHLGDLP